MDSCNIEFWNALDELVNNSEIVIERLKGQHTLNILTSFIELTMNIKKILLLWMVPE